MQTRLCTVCAGCGAGSLQRDLPRRLGRRPAPVRTPWRASHRGGGAAARLHASHGAMLSAQAGGVGSSCAFGGGQARAARALARRAQEGVDGGGQRVHRRLAPRADGAA
eukprot:343287-Pleurochrysis_carterae.AAC.5